MDSVVRARFPRRPLRDGDRIDSLTVELSDVDSGNATSAEHKLTSTTPVIDISQTLPAPLGRYPHDAQSQRHAGLACVSLSVVAASPARQRCVGYSASQPSRGLVCGSVAYRPLGPLTLWPALSLCLSALVLLLLLLLG